MKAVLLALTYEEGIALISACACTESLSDAIGEEKVAEGLRKRAGFEFRVKDVTSAVQKIMVQMAAQGFKPPGPKPTEFI